MGTSNGHIHVQCVKYVFSMIGWSELYTRLCVCVCVCVCACVCVYVCVYIYACVFIKQTL